MHNDVSQSSPELPNGFLAQIIQHPDDNAYRLILADWLEDQGDSERAMYIRWAIELSQINLKELYGEKINPQHRDNLSDKCDSLLKKNRANWGKGLAKYASASFVESYHRGLIESIILDGGDYIKYGQIIHEKTPVRDLVLFNVRDKLSEILNIQLLNRIISLTILAAPADYLVEHDIKLILNSSHLQKLQMLKFESSESSAIVKLFQQTSSLCCLELLRINGVFYNDLLSQQRDSSNHQCEWLERWRNLSAGQNQETLMGQQHFQPNSTVA